MKYILFVLGFIPFNLQGQPNLLNQLAVPASFLPTPGARECNNSYYVSSVFEKNVSFYPTFPWLKPIQFTLSKFDVTSHALLASTVVYGDTLQADSTVVGFQPQIQIKDNRIHLAYTKRIVHDTFSQPLWKQHWWALYYKQLDTNLNVVVPERQLKLTGYSEKLSGLYLQTMNVDDRVTLAFIQQDTSINGPSDVSKYIQLDMAGNIIREDSLGLPNVSAQNPYHRVAEVNTYPGHKYLISGMNLYNVPNVYNMFYLADSSMNKLDTFALKPFFFYNPPDVSGYFVRYPNFVALPSGSIIGGGPYSHSPAGQTHTGLIKCTPANRFKINKLISFKGVDAADGGHSSGPSIHNLVYNEYDNSIYYVDVTHSNLGGACNGFDNYIQVLSLDTNLNLKWKKYLQPGANQCSFAGYVEKCDNRPGILISGSSSNNTDPQNLALYVNFVYHIDSAIVAGLSKDLKSPIRDRVVAFPNPAKGYIQIDDIFSSEGWASLYNLNGKVVRQITYTKTQNRIDIKDLPPGLYILRIVTEDQETTSFKFLKE